MEKEQITDRLHQLEATVLAQQIVLIWLARDSARKSWHPEAEIQDLKERFLAAQANSALTDVSLLLARQKLDELVHYIGAETR